jgi:hypothetical protein
MLVLKMKQEDGKEEDASLRRPMYVHPDRRLTSAQVIEEARLREKLNGWTVAQLQKLCQINEQKKSGTKDILVSRCVDGIMRGALPRCPQVTLSTARVARAAR